MGGYIEGIWWRDPRPALLVLHEELHLGRDFGAAFIS